MTILDEIFANKRSEVAHRKGSRSLAQVREEAAASTPPLDFVGALRNPPSASSTGGSPALIAEIKRASPSRGLLLPDFNPLHLARLYQQNGAAAISVLTDERYFRGHLDYLRQIAQVKPRLPLLCKDFIFDPYQVYEARAAGADAILLIVACLEPAQLHHLLVLAAQLGMAALVEVHTLPELKIALSCQPALVGVNNRDLHDFSVSLETTLRLRASIPPEICLVSESGIHTPQDVKRLAEADVDAILVGEALVTAADKGEKVRSLVRLDPRIESTI